MPTPDLMFHFTRSVRNTIGDLQPLTRVRLCEPGTTTAPVGWIVYTVDAIDGEFVEVDPLNLSFPTGVIDFYCSHADFRVIDIIVEKAGGEEEVFPSVWVGDRFGGVVDSGAAPKFIVRSEYEGLTVVFGGLPLPTPIPVNTVYIALPDYFPGGVS